MRRREIDVRREPREEHHAGAECVRRLRGEPPEPDALRRHARLVQVRLVTAAPRGSEQIASARTLSVRITTTLRGCARSLTIAGIGAGVRSDTPCRACHVPVTSVRTTWIAPWTKQGCPTGVAAALQEAAVDLVVPEAEERAAEEHVRNGKIVARCPRKPRPDAARDVGEQQRDHRAHEQHRAEQPRPAPREEPVPHGAAERDAEAHRVATDVRVEDALIEQLRAEREGRDREDPADEEQSAERAHPPRGGAAVGVEKARGEPEREDPECSADQQRARVDAFALGREVGDDDSGGARRRGAARARVGMRRRREGAWLFRSPTSRRAAFPRSDSGARASGRQAAPWTGRTPKTPESHPRRASRSFPPCMARPLYHGPEPSRGVCWPPPMGTPLEGKVALVTGASSGIGEATALGLAAAGARVVVAARRADRLASLVARITAAGGTALALPADVAREADARRDGPAGPRQVGAPRRPREQRGADAPRRRQGNGPHRRLAPHDRGDEPARPDVRDPRGAAAHEEAQKSGHFVNVSSMRRTHRQPRRRRVRRDENSAYAHFRASLRREVYQDGIPRHGHRAGRRRHRRARRSASPTPRPKRRSRLAWPR